MSFLDVADYALAFSQGILAILLWHQAEPRFLQARGRWSAVCAMALGFVLALSFPIAFSRPLGDWGATQWQGTLRDACLVLYAACLYHRAMRLGHKPELA